MLTTLKKTILIPKFALEDLEDFPIDTYNEQKSVYQNAENWFLGTALTEQSSAYGKKVDLYPMRINPIQGTVLKHAYTLMGEVEDDGRPLILTKMITRSSDELEIAKVAEEAINTIWWESMGRALMIENAILAQIYGGCVFKASFVPGDKERSIPVRIDRVRADEFIGYPEADNYRLSEAWIVRIIDAQQARLLGYKPDMDEEEFYYTEHWTRDSYIVRVNDQVAISKLDGNPRRQEGANDFGFVPIVYIPHVRAGYFLGMNVIDNLIGQVKELNRVFGDYGDAVNDDSHPIIAFRNVTGNIVMTKITSWLEALNLGNTQNIVGSEPEPDMWEVRTPRASAAMQELIREVWSQYQRDSDVPPVAYGEDEGSQRSSLTLTTRFWPLISHTGIERYYWTSGLDIFQRYLLKIMEIKKLAEITAKHAAFRMKHRWAPQLPRDREVDVQEWVARTGSDLGSVDLMLELAGDVEDVEFEKKRMLEWKKKLGEIQTEIAVKSRPPVDNSRPAAKEKEKKS